MDILSFISNKPTKLLREEVLQWFGNKEKYIKTQLELTQFYYTFSGAIEDDD
jgi:hypothetical protein